MNIFDNVIDALEHFKSFFMGVINNIAPIQQNKAKAEGLTNTEILKSIKDKDTAFRELKKFKTEDKYSFFKDL